MTRPETAQNAGTLLKRHHERLQDEVYRQVFRLEAHRQGAELDLSVALLRAWQAAGEVSALDQDWQWLKKICPICIEMIERASVTRIALPPNEL